MAKPTRTILLLQRAFERRQNTYEKRYFRQMYTLLRKNYFYAAEKYKQGLRWNDYPRESFERFLNNLYENVILSESKIEWALTVEPYLPKKKDIIEDLAEALSRFTSGNVFTIWRQLLEEFISVRTTGRITRIMETTNRRITEIISRGIENGEGAEVIARNIRREAGEPFNRNRALLIARTEVVTSMNQGKFLSAKTSPYVMEKRWSPVYQPGRTRESHIEFFNSDFIDLETDFTVGIYRGRSRIGEEVALYPGDLRLSVGNVANCRCSLVTRPKRNTNGQLLRK